MEQQIDAALMHEVERIGSQYSHALVTLLNPIGVIQYASRASEDLLGFRPEELVGQSFADYIAPEDLEHAFLALQDAMLNEQSVEVSVGILTKSGEFTRMRGFAYQLVGPETDEVFLLTRAERLPE